MRRLAAFFLTLAVVLPISCVIPARAADTVDVTAYTYTITPVLSPFYYCLYVQTDNPDPCSFRLVDEDSKFYTAEDRGRLELAADDGIGTVFAGVEPGTYYNIPIFLRGCGL